MTNFKIVPVEPTEEMLRVACDEEQRPLPMWTRMKAIYTATLNEAPVINIVATKNEQGQIISVTLQDEDHRILEVIAEADVQGEHEDDSATVRMDKQCREAVADALGFMRGGNYAWSYLLQQIKDITSAAEAQQPSPDVTALVEALEQIERWDGFPSTGKTWEGSGEPVSYGAAFGSNGERDFMREVARKALSDFRKGAKT